MDLFGTYFIQRGVTPGTEKLSQVTGWAFTHAEKTTGYTNAQSSFVEELQLQGTPGDGRFTWQAGAYVELNDPLGASGVQTASLSACTDVTTFNCTGFTPGLAVGAGQLSLSKTKFASYALYAQGSYKLTDRLTFTAGIRHTWDRMKSQIANLSPNFSALTGTCSNLTAPEYGQTFPLSQRFGRCLQDLEKNTKAPTWMVNLDYKPIDAVMVYGKWSRGYRQGGLAFFGPDPLQPYDAEKVDTYELGLKSSWRGAFPGFFNISGFYNDFTNQQLLLGVSCDSNKPGFKGPCTGNAAVVNAASSTLKGFEADLGVTAFEILRLGASYGYLKTKLKEFVEPVLPVGGPWNSVNSPLIPKELCATVPQCNVIPNSVPHKLTLSANLDLPVGEEIGKLSVGGTWIYTSSYRVVLPGAPTLHPRAGMLPSSKVLNLNATWESVAGLPVDLSAFVTNVTNEHVYLQANDNLASRGFLSYLVGEPRMWGARLRYRFGD